MAARRRVGPKRVEAFVSRIFEPSMHAKRVLSLGRAAVGAVRASSLAIHAIGRAKAVALGLDPKHAIKQVDRLLSNDGLDPDTFFPTWVQSCIGTHREIVVALDWTDFDADGHTTIALNLVTGAGRALPLMWKTVLKEELAGARNDHEDDLIVRFSEAVPEGVRVTLLADRGFADQALYELLTRLGFDFVIRFRSAIHVTAQGESRKAAEWVPTTGRPVRLLDAEVTAARYRVGSVVCVKAKGMKEAWCLATSLKVAASTIVKLYGRRFTIEETFRDIKDLRFGLGLSTVRIKDVKRRDRLLLITAIVTVLLTLLGAAGESVGLDRRLKASTTTKRTHSLFFQGCHYYEALPEMKVDQARRLVAAFEDLLRAHPAFSLLFMSGA